MTSPLCSDESLDVGESIQATAPPAAAWLAIEQPGPWGADAMTSSGLDPVLGRALAQLATAQGVRAVLIRRPGGHPRPGPATRTVLIGYTYPGRSWLIRGHVADPAQLLRLDFAAIGAGAAPTVVADRLSAESQAPAVEVREPMILVCANSKRDQCCALKGRPVAARLAELAPDRVWESSHLGGHRFAATALVLPGGYLYGRLTEEVAPELLARVDSGQLLVDRARGRSTWSPAGQLAELAVRRDVGELDVDAVAVTEPTDRSTWPRPVMVRHQDGRGWRVWVNAINGRERPASCGKAAEAISALTQIRLERLSHGS